jgi:hypothetical protein
MVGAANDADFASHALVEIARTARCGSEHGVGDDKTVRRAQHGRIDAQRIAMQRAAMVGAVQRQQARLACNEGEGLGCAHRHAHDGAGIAVDSAGHIQCQHRHAAGGEGVDLFHQRGMAARERSCQPDSEQPVDDQVPVGRRSIRNIGAGPAAGRFPFFKCEQGIGRQV